MTRFFPQWLAGLLLPAGIVLPLLLLPLFCVALALGLSAIPHAAEPAHEQARPGGSNLSTQTFDDSLALKHLAQCQWEQTHAPDSPDRWLAISMLGGSLRDRRVSEPVRAQLVTWLESMQGDPNAHARQEAQRVLRNAPTQ
jgi:hypothetical protein